MDTQSLFEKAEQDAKRCYEQIKSYDEVGANPHELDFSAEMVIFNTMHENITRLKVRNKHDEITVQKLALNLSDYMNALAAIMDARIYLSVDMKEDAYETMGRRIYEPRITIQEITKSIKKALGDDYKDPGALLSEEQKTISTKSLYSLDEYLV